MASVGEAAQIDFNTALYKTETLQKDDKNSSPSVWTGADFRTAVRLLAAAELYYAVPDIVLEAELEKDQRLQRAGLTGSQVLLSMVESNVLAVRPYSKLAKDIPRGVFFRKIGVIEIKVDFVVVMPSPAHLHAALEESRRGGLD